MRPDPVSFFVVDSETGDGLLEEDAARDDVWQQTEELPPLRLVGLCQGAKRSNEEESRVTNLMR